MGKSTDGQHIAIDGKSFRQSFDNASGTGMLHLVNAWSTDHGICFGQHAVDRKSNEITAVPKLLDMMQINGATITLDAMHCQHATAGQIIDRGADYVISVKGNQQTLASEIHQAFIDADESQEAAKAAGMRMKVEQPQKRLSKDSRTRQIKRSCSVMPVPANLRNCFPGIRSIVRMYREQQRPQKDGSVKESGEVSFCVNSLQPIVRDHAKLIRDHWKVENQLHWSLDMTFNEDQRRNRKNNGAAMAGFISRLALSILSQDTSIEKTSLRCKRKVCGWNSDALEAVLTNFAR